MSPPAFQFYPGDFLSDGNQMVMSLAGAGAYIRLMCTCWKDGSLPNDVRKLWKLAQSDSLDEFKAVWPDVKVCFRKRPDGRLVHPRLEKELRKQDEYRRKMSEAGKKGAKKRHQKPAPPKDDPGQAITRPQPGLGNRIALQSSSSSLSSTSVTTSVDKSTGASPVVDNSKTEKSEQMTWSDFAGWFRTKGHMILWNGLTPPRGAPDGWGIHNDLSIAKRIHSTGVSLELIRGVIEAGVWSEKLQGFEANRGITMAWYADKKDPERWGIAAGKYEMRQEQPIGRRSRQSNLEKIEVELGGAA